MDLVMRGHATEQFGAYFPMCRSGDVRRFVEARDLLGTAKLNLSDGELLAWAGWLRRPSFEQMMALEPDAAAGILNRLCLLREDGYLTFEAIPLNKGTLSGLCLTKAGWKAAKDVDPMLISAGVGPRKFKPSNREFHEQVVGDAIVYLRHEYHCIGAKVNSIVTEDQLRSTYPYLETYPDIQMAADMGVDRIPFRQEIEVVGLGSRYKGAGHHSKIQGGYIRRVFSHRGPQGAKGGNINVGR